MNGRIEPALEPHDPPPLPPRVPRESCASQERGLHGCLVALIVCGALAIPLIGILAAIAIPQYQIHMLRAKAGRAMAHARSFMADVEVAHADHGRCPAGRDIDPHAHQATSNPDIASIMIGEVEEGHCGVRVTLRGHTRLAGRHIVLERFSDGTWICASDIDPRYSPEACQRHLQPWKITIPRHDSRRTTKE